MLEGERFQYLYLQIPDNSDKVIIPLNNVCTTEPDEKEIMLTIVQATIPPFLYFHIDDRTLFLYTEYDTGTSTYTTYDVKFSGLKYFTDATDFHTQLDVVLATLGANLKTKLVSKTDAYGHPFTQVLEMDKKTIGSTFNPYSLEVLTMGCSDLLGIPVGLHYFSPISPFYFPDPAQPLISTDVLIAPPRAIYLHTDIPSKNKNIDNINRAEPIYSDVFCKIAIPDPTLTTDFYDNTGTIYKFLLEALVFDTISFTFKDLNQLPIIPQESWGLVLLVKYFKVPDYHETWMLNYLKEIAERLKLMWLSQPPTTLRKQL
jgi:hypothetical protein